MFKKKVPLQILINLKYDLISNLNSIKSNLDKKI